MLKEKSEKPTKKLSLKTITLKDLQAGAGGALEGDDHIIGSYSEKTNL